MAANYRNFIRFILVPVIIISLLLNLDEIARTKTDALDKMVDNSLHIAAEKIRASVSARNSSHQRMNQKNVHTPKPRSNVLQNRKHSKKSPPQNSDTKGTDGGKKNIFKTQASKSSSWTKWRKLLKNPKIIHKKHLLVIVTTWISSEEKQLVHENVVRLWSYWPKLVQPIVYLLPADNNTIDQKKKKNFIDDFNMLIQNGWIVRPIPKVSCGDVPVLKFMILDAMKLFPKSDFYGFANSDILFDSGLIETLESTKRLVPARFPVLVLGQRTNLNVTRGVRFTNPDSVLQASKNGSLMKGVAIDYFITNNLFPWEKIPDLVVGRIHYDNWMIYFGISQDAIVIEASETLTALHQTTADGNAAGWGHAHRYCNKNTIQKSGKHFQTRWGYTWCAPHKALRNPKTGSIELKTKRVSSSCNPRPPPFDFSTGMNLTDTNTKQKIRNVGKT